MEEIRPRQKKGRWLSYEMTEGGRRDSKSSHISCFMFIITAITPIVDESSPSALVATFEGPISQALIFASYTIRTVMSHHDNLATSSSPIESGLGLCSLIAIFYLAQSSSLHSPCVWISCLSPPLRKPTSTRVGNEVQETLLSRILIPRTTMTMRREMGRSSKETELEEARYTRGL